MPLLYPAGYSLLLPSLVGVGMLGVGTPKLASAVTQGVIFWASSRSVNTKDVGTSGVGKGLGLLPVTSSLLYPLLLQESLGAGMLGIFTPVFMIGLSSGLSSFLSLATVQTNHPTVGVGTGIATVTGPPSFASFDLGFQTEGISGESSRRIAQVLGNTFDKVFPSLPIPLAIVGPSSPNPSSGVGVGKVLLWASI